MSNCPCGTGQSYENCCQPFHQGQAYPDQAENLMRARYSAFVKNEIDFILNTHHPDTQSQVERGQVEQWSKESVWDRLEIIDTYDSPVRPLVEFKAHYKQDGITHTHHEKAVFKKHQDRWYYLDSEFIPETVVRTGPKIKRNDPCPCGSGKKYKRCCLN
jgi:SEC-C motif-containing protein